MTVRLAVWAVWGVSTAAMAAAFALSLLYWPSERVETGGLVIAVSVLGALGASVVQRRPAIRPGWMLLGLAPAVGFANLGWAVAWATAGGAGNDPWYSRAAVASADGSFGLALLLLVLLALVAPDGRLPGRWSLPLRALACLFAMTWLPAQFVAGITLTSVRAYLGSPGLVDGADASESAAVLLAGLTGGASLAILAIASVVAMAFRYRSSGLEARQQLKWVALGCLAAFALQSGYLYEATEQPWQTLQDLVPAATCISLSLGFGLALHRYRLWEIDVLVQRSAIYGAYLAATTLFLGGLALSLGLVTNARGPTWLAITATVLATLGIQPLRNWLEHLAARVGILPRRQPSEANPSWHANGWFPPPLPSNDCLYRLTPRERDVLEEMAQGRSNQAIARALSISESAVEKHISAIFGKLALEPTDAALNRRVAAVLAFLHGDEPAGSRGPGPAPAA